MCCYSSSLLDASSRRSVLLQVNNVIENRNSNCCERDVHYIYLFMHIYLLLKIYHFILVHTSNIISENQIILKQINNNEKKFKTTTRRGGK